MSLFSYQNHGDESRRGITEQKLFTQISLRSPIPTVVLRNQGWPAAEWHAERVGGLACQVLGDAMAPLYPHCTSCVILPLRWAHLRSGQTIVYLGEAGRRMTRAVVGRCMGNYIVQGLDFRWPDPSPVGRERVVGVVIAAYVDELRANHGLHL